MSSFSLGLVGLPKTIKESPTLSNFKRLFKTGSLFHLIILGHIFLRSVYIVFTFYFVVYIDTFIIVMQDSS